MRGSCALNSPTRSFQAWVTLNCNSRDAIRCTTLHVHPIAVLSITTLGELITLSSKGYHRSHGYHPSKPLTLSFIIGRYIAATTYLLEIPFPTPLTRISACFNSYRLTFYMSRVNFYSPRPPLCPFLAPHFALVLFSSLSGNNRVRGRNGNSRGDQPIVMEGRMKERKRGTERGHAIARVHVNLMLTRHGN